LEEDINAAKSGKPRAKAAVKAAAKRKKKAAGDDDSEEDVDFVVKAPKAKPKPKASPKKGSPLKRV
jgi:DNA topoisomerase-2